MKAELVPNEYNSTLALASYWYWEEDPSHAMINVTRESIAQLPRLQKCFPNEFMIAPCCTTYRKLVKVNLKG